MSRRSLSVPLFRRHDDGFAPAGRPLEPELDLDDIQGNSIVGFNKSFQTLLFFHIDDAAAFKPVVGALGQRVARAEDVLAFNRLFKRTRSRGALKATWVNLAFSSAGLAKLTSEAQVSLFADPSFRGGLVGRPGILGDPASWQPRDGRGDASADVLIIVAADTVGDLAAGVAEIEALVQGKGVSLAGREEGRAISGTPAARDHFGFVDGISQPGIRGRVSSLPNDFLTPRHVPEDPDQGKPGQELVWPGEFVFGYPDQDGGRDPGWVGDWLKDGAGFSVAPPWARNGSFLVFGRFEQDVTSFRKFLDDNRKIVDQATGEKEDPVVVSARVVGRWPSGAPIILAAQKDDETIAGDEQANNRFGFGADPAGEVCPRNAHIRKANPRDQVERPADRLRHRVLRRGIPYGKSPGPDVAVEDKRGLLFLGYMTSIVDQFEFVMQHWLKDPNFPVAGSGPDRLMAEAGQDWITASAGGYYFAPSISALTGPLSA